MQTFNSQSSNHALLLAGAILLSSLLVGGMLTTVDAPIVLAGTVGVLVFLLCFAIPPFALYLLVFSMLLSPEFGQRTAEGGGGSGVTIRLDDLLLVVIGFSWLARIAIDKNLGFFRQTPLNRPIFGYLLACLLSTLIGVFMGNVKPVRGFFYVLKYFEYYVVFFMLVNNVSSSRDIRRFVTAMLITCFIIDLVGLAQVPSGDRISAPFEGKSGEPNTLGGYLVLMSAISFSLAVHLKSMKATLVLWALSALSVVTILFTRSRGSYLAFVAMYLALIAFSRKRILVAILIAGAAAGPYLVPAVVVERIAYTFEQRHHRLQKQVGGVALDTSTSERLQGWVDGGKAFLQRPIFGWGVTGFGFFDSQYLVVLVETGLAGITAFAALLWAILRQSWISSLRVRQPLHRGLCIGFLAGAVGMVMHGASANTFIIVRVMEPFWFLAGLVIMCPLVEKRESKATEGIS